MRSKTLLAINLVTSFIFYTSPAFATEPEMIRVVGKVGSPEMSRVVAKVGSLIYLANQQTFAIERPTILHIDGTMYPKGSGSPDLIQVGYRCRFTGREYNVIEVFCKR